MGHIPHLVESVKRSLGAAEKSASSTLEPRAVTRTNGQTAKNGDEPEGRYVYKYWHPAVTVDCIVFGWDGEALHVLLVKRGGEPYKGFWAIPGGFLRSDETLEEAAARELWEETGIRPKALEQFHAFGAVNRDPRERVVTIAYLALVPLCDQSIRADTDACDAVWIALHELPALAFDHNQIMEQALGTLRKRARLRPLGLELLPPAFTLQQLQRLYEAILGRSVDPAAFRAQLTQLNLLVSTGEMTRDAMNRAQPLYRFDRQQYDALGTADYFLAV